MRILGFTKALNYRKVRELQAARVPPPKPGVDWYDHVMGRLKEKGAPQYIVNSVDNWLHSSPGVPNGKWTATFPEGWKVVGNGWRPQTSLAPHNAPYPNSQRFTVKDQYLVAPGEKPDYIKYNIDFSKLWEPKVKV